MSIKSIVCAILIICIVFYVGMINRMFVMANHVLQLDIATVVVIIPAVVMFIILMWIIMFTDE